MRSQELLAVGLFGSGSRLGDRIELLLRRGRTFSGRISKGRLAASALALAACLVAGALAPRWIAFAQQPAFEVASVKPANPAGRQRVFQGGPGSKDPERIDIQGYSMLGLLLTAYDTKAYQISGPGWIQDTRFDIQAKVPPGATRAQVPGMLQALLVERFGLKVHHETKDFDGYDLVVAKGGHKLKPAEPPGAPPPQPDKDGFAPCGGSACYQTSASGSRIVARRMPLADLARYFDPIGEKPVRDQTGLTGEFAFKMVYEDPRNPPAATADTASEPVPDLFTALQQQLGLKLEPMRIPLDVVVLDHVERVPSAN
jgi:uncharacterized protein (TIGR03435 family)